MNAAKAIRILSVVTLILAVLSGSSRLAAALVFLCVLMAVILLYRHLPALSGVSPESPKARTLRLVTGLCIAVVILSAVLAALEEIGLICLSDQTAAALLPILFSALIIGLGNLSPKLPFNRYTGLRLPWTVSDEETWIVAHRILGWLSLPCGLLCLTGLANASDPAAIPVAMLLVWIIIPSALSGLFFYRKYRAKKK